MICPFCNATYATISYCDPTGDDRVKRRRRCVECNRVFATVEVYAEMFERLEMRAANFQTLVSPEARSAAKAMMDKRLVKSYVNRPLGGKEGE